MRQAKIELTITIPDTEATDEEIKEWIKFETGYSSSIEIKNPLQSEPLEVEYCNIDLD